jgi:MFS family permease
MSMGLHLQPQHRIFAAFALHAFAMGNIFPRMPDIKAAMGVAEGTLGLSLMGLPVGTLLALTFAAPILERTGFRRSLLAIMPLVSTIYAIAVHATNPVVFFLILIPIGMAIGCIEIIINVEADRTEAMISKRIMNRCHAFWSFGFFGAGLFGALLAHIGISPKLHLALVIPVSLLAIRLFLGQYQPAPTRSEEAGNHVPKFASPTWPILVLVGVTLSAMLMEGAGIDWSAIYMRNIFASGPFVAGAAVALVALSQAMARFFVDDFIDHHSPAGVARFLLWGLGAGVVLVLAAFSPIISLLGFALIGIGTSAIFPMAVSAAAQRTDRPAAINVASLVQIAFTAFLVGPPLLGFVAEHWGIQWTYGIAIPLVILSIVTAGTLGKEQLSKVTPT